MNIYPVNIDRLENNVSTGNYDLDNANNFSSQGFPALDYLLYGVGSSDSEIIEKLEFCNCKAQSITTKKNNIFTVVPERKELGYVGNPKKINKKILLQIVKKKEVPVIIPMGSDEDQIPYNINADTVAGAVAGALKASKLLLLTDVDGILDQNNKLISSLSYKEALKIYKKKYISGGMKPKITTCIEAISKGVKEATILDGRISHALILELFTEHGIGTQIYSKLNVKNKK